MTDLTSYKTCSRCKAVVPAGAGIGDQCPNCGAVFSSEQPPGMAAPAWAAPPADPASPSSWNTTPGALSRAERPGALSGAERPSTATLLAALIATALFLPTEALAFLSGLGRWTGPVLFLIPALVIGGKAVVHAEGLASWPYLLLIVSALAELLAGVLNAAASFGVIPWGPYMFMVGVSSTLLAAGYLAWAFKSVASSSEEDQLAGTLAVAVLIGAGSVLILRTAVMALRPGGWGSAIATVFALIVEAALIAGAVRRAVRVRAWPDFLQLGAAGLMPMLLVGLPVLMRLFSARATGADFHSDFAARAALSALVHFAFAIGFLCASHPSRPAGAQP